MKIWLDDVRPAPEGYVWCKSVNGAKIFIINIEAKARVDKEYNLLYNENFPITKIELIDIDHDAGEYSSHGGDYIKLLDWFEETGRNYPIHIHSANQINLLQMREIIERNGWTEVRCSTCRFRNYSPYDEICVRCENYNGWIEI